MNHTLNLKISLISTLLLAQSFAIAADPMPVELKPIRKAKGTVQIDRLDTTWNAAKNDINITTTPVCKLTYDVPVFDIRNRASNFYTTPGMVTCKDIVGTELIEINAGSSFNIVSGSAISLPQDIKMYSGFAYLRTMLPNPLNIPRIQNQDAFTIDLNQVNFGLLAMAPAGAICMVESAPQPVNPGPQPIPVDPEPGPTPQPHLMAKKVKSLSGGTDPNSCKIIFPVAYQAIWMAEDRP